MKKKLIISKLDAAKRQIEIAIRLYFCNGDPVSIHILTAASYNILKDLNRKSDGMPLLVKEQLLDLLKEEHKKEMRGIINATENFFKHADRDHYGTLEFNPDQSEMLIYEACSVYWNLSGEYPPLFKLFQGWFMANNQNLFNLSEELKNAVATVKLYSSRLGREGYFNEALPLVMKLNISPPAALDHRYSESR